MLKETSIYFHTVLMMNITVCLCVYDGCIREPCLFSGPSRHPSPFPSRLKTVVPSGWRREALGLIGATTQQISPLSTIIHLPALNKEEEDEKEEEEEGMNKTPPSFRWPVWAGWSMDWHHALCQRASASCYKQRDIRLNNRRIGSIINHAVLTHRTRVCLFHSA